jgi:hypothetical protein
MPSVGRIKKLSALGVAAAAAFGVSASSASANDVWLWACHGPQGQALGSGPFKVSEIFTGAGFPGGIFSYGDECADGAAEGLGGGGLTAALSERAGDPPANQAVQGQAEASLRLDVPPGLKLQAVKILRQTRGFSTEEADSGNPQEYSLTTAGGTLERVSLADEVRGDKNGEAEFAVTGGPAAGDWLKIAVKCATGSPSTPCPASDPVEVDVSRVGLKVSDTSKPKAAVGGTQSPASGDMKLNIPASDDGSGLKEVVVNFGNLPAKVVRFGGTNCEELSPGDNTVDLRLDANCTTFDQSAQVTINTREVPDGDYDLRVRVYDWAGNVHEEPVRRIQVLNNPPRGQSSQTLNIGTSGVADPNQGGAPAPSGGDVLGASTQRCNSPRLSMFLSQKPLRVRRGVPVLKAGKRYRFNGRLTCVINGRRVSAPKRARVDIFNRVGNRTLEKAGTTVRNRGNLTVILAYKTSRVITFRFTNTDGRSSTVRIRVIVARR